MKHIGKMKNNGAKVVVAYRTLPGDSGNCLVVGTGGLSDAWHDGLMALVQDTTGQQANELADVMAVRKFTDGQNMLEALHKRGQLKKVPTSGVIMTPGPNAEILLSELNGLIAEQKGVTIDELAVTDGFNPNTNPARPQVNNNTKTVKNDDPTKTTSASVNAAEDDYTPALPTEVVFPTEQVESVVTEGSLSPAQLRSKADALFKQAQTLRKEADAIDPPKKRAKTTKAVTE
jgi:hypothetical protein